MTTTTNLIKKLRDVAWSDESHSNYLYDEAADLLEAQAKQIEALQADVCTLLGAEQELRLKLKEAPVAPAQPLTKEQVEKVYVWECNECGSQEYTMAVSASDVHDLGCVNCGSSEWHKEEAKI